MINRKNLSDYSSLKKPNKDGEIVKEYTSIKLKTEPTELQKYYEYLTNEQAILDEVNYVADRMKREDLRSLREEYRFLEELKIERQKELLKEEQREAGIKKISGEIISNNDITPTIQTPMELEDERFSTDLSAKMNKSIEYFQEKFKEEDRKDKASSKIQRAIKGKIAREKVSQLREENKASSVLQGAIRGKQTKKLEQLREENKASSVLQGAIRGKQAKKLEQLREENKASSVLQGAIRGKQIRNEFEKAKKGITKFQGIVRGEKERLKYDKMLEDISSATTTTPEKMEVVEKQRKQRSDKGVKRGSYKKK